MKWRPPAGRTVVRVDFVKRADGVSRADSELRICSDPAEGLLVTNGNPPWIEDPLASGLPVTNGNPPWTEGRHFKSALIFLPS
jgi:hypothetical protein